MNSKNQASQIPQNQPENGHSVGYSAFLVAIGTFSSRVLGFVRDAMMTAYFNRTVTDAWIAAFRLPNMFRRLLGEGALSVSFIPVFNALLTKEGPSKAQGLRPSQKLVAGVFTVLLSITIPLTLLGTLFARPIVEWLTVGEGFTSVPGKVDLTVRLTQIMFVYIFLVSLYAYFMAILNSLKQFWLPGFAPVLWNVAMIVSTLPIFGEMTIGGEILAWGVVVGGILQVGILVPALYRSGFFPTMLFDFKNPDLLQVFKAIGPSLLGLGIMQITIVVNTRFASYLPEGANTWIYLADRLLELPLSLFAVSMGTALLPTLSTFWARGQKAEFHRSTAYYLRSVFFLSLPAALGLYSLAEPIVKLLFARKNFSDHDVTQTATVLQVYSIAILTYAGVRVIAPAFYAVKNTWFPAVCSFCSLVLHLFLAQILIKEFGVQGLTLSTVISSALNVILLFVGYRFLIGHFSYREFGMGLLRFVPASAVMALTLKIYSPLFEKLSEVEGLNIWFIRILSLSFVIGFAACAYFLVSALTRVPEFTPVANRIRSKVMAYFTR